MELGMNLFLDTSAVVKLYHQEKGTDALSSFLQQNAKDLILLIADITKLEFHSAILRRVRLGEITPETAQQAFELFDRDLQMYYINETNAITITLAIQLLDQLASQKSLKSFDSLQLSAALISNRFAKIDYFVSSDKALLAIPHDYFPVINPEEQ